MKNNCRFLSLALSLVFLLSSFSFVVLPASADTVSQPLAESIDSLEGFQAIAERYMGADIEKTGITASINKEGRLQIKQVLSKSPARSGVSAEQVKEVALSTLLVVDQYGIERDYPDSKVSSGSSQNVYAIHTTNYVYRQDPANPIYIQCRVSSTKTSFVYGTAQTASSFYQRYLAWSGSEREGNQSNTISFPSAGRDYTFVPTSNWFYLGDEISLGSKAVVTVGSNTFTVLNEYFLG